MYRRAATLLSLFAILTLVPGPKAQLKSKATFYGGFTYNILSLKPQGSNLASRFPYYGLTAGMDYVMLHSNDVVSLGINPNAIFSIQYNANQGASMLLQTPLYLLARLGANSTPFNEQKFGIGAGIGLNYSYMSQKSLVQDSNGNTYQLRIAQGFINPTAVAEISINARGWNNIIRFHWSLYKPTHEIRVGVDRYPFEFGVGGLGLLYNF